MIKETEKKNAQEEVKMTFADKFEDFCEEHENIFWMSIIFGSVVVGAACQKIFKLDK